MISLDDERKIIIQTISKSIYDMAMDHEATHVLQKIIADFGEEYVKDVIKKVIADLVPLSQNAYGICVVKRVIEKLGPSNEMTEIINILAEHIIEVAQSSFGNYAIQHALEKWKVSKCMPIFEAVLTNFSKLSVQRFSSNVVEKFILESDPESLKRILVNLNDDVKMQTLISNKFGNYVLNKLSNRLKGDDFKYLENLIVDASKKVKPYSASK